LAPASRTLRNAAFRACSARLRRSSGFRIRSGSTWRSNLASWASLLLARYWSCLVNASCARQVWLLACCSIRQAASSSGQFESTSCGAGMAINLAAACKAEMTRLCPESRQGKMPVFIEENGDLWTELGMRVHSPSVDSRVSARPPKGINRGPRAKVVDQLSNQVLETKGIQILKMKTIDGSTRRSSSPRLIQASEPATNPRIHIVRLAVGAGAAIGCRSTMGVRR